MRNREYTTKLTTEVMKGMNLPRRFWKSKLGMVEEPQVAYIKHYVDNIHDMLDEGVGLVLYGPNGTGKSSAASIIAKAARVVQASVYYTTVSGLMEDVFRKANHDIYPVEDIVKMVDLLVLDDLGKEHRGKTDWSQNFIESLIRQRNDRKTKSTIVTTNLIVNPEKNENQLLDEYHYSMVESMRESMLPILFAGKNFRDEKQSKLKDMFGAVEE